MGFDSLELLVRIQSIPSYAFPIPLIARELFPKSNFIALFNSVILSEFSG